MSQQSGGQPIVILRQGTTRNREQEARNNNITAAMAVANAVRSTSGPKGMDKMHIDDAFASLRAAGPSGGMPPVAGDYYL